MWGRAKRYETVEEDACYLQKGKTQSGLVVSRPWRAGHLYFKPGRVGPSFYILFSNPNH